MLLNALLAQWSRDTIFCELCRGASARAGYRAAVTGLDGAARSFFFAGLAAERRRPVLVIAADAARAEKIYEDLLAFFPREAVNLLPARELFITAEILTQSREQRQQRLYFFEWLYQNKGGVFVAPFTALVTPALPPAAWRRLILELQVGRPVHRAELLGRLVELGYERTELIEGRGQYSARGEIVDIFPFGREQPLRIELGEELVESIRLFDPETQRSTQRLERTGILPAYELILPEEVFRAGEKNLRREANETAARLRRRGEGEAAARLEANVERHLERLARPGGLDVLSGYFSYFYGFGATLPEYLPEEALVLLDEPESILEKAAVLERELESHSGNVYLQGELLPGQVASFRAAGSLLTAAPCAVIACILFPGPAQEFKPARVFSLEAKSVPYYHGQWELLKNDFERWSADGYRVCFLAGTAERGAALAENLRRAGLPVAAAPERPWRDNPAAPVQMVAAGLEEGFLLPSLKLAVVAEPNLLPRHRKKRRLAHKEGIRLRDYRELVVGDFVVHEQHGIGKYLGLSTLEISGAKRDYLLVKYRGTDRLYLPVDQIGLIQKYVGAEGKAPRLHSLGSGEWHRLKNKVKASVRELAGELLSLYATRQATRGHAFAADHPWQLEFEARFPYEETADQLQAIAEVKADMEKAQPMDRLICGDVGYGKTEVALRAAFKAAMEGKQAALLVPTTILAQQHYRTFRERFAEFPLRVAQLSRFVSPAEQKAILKDLAAGRVDIVIGTHRLLSRDVSFHDLGLLIIDEEQRFGVRHKEKLKQMRLNVDVLAMTATPIPRTMHLSLVGARDLSVIETPPENRYPVQTFVAEYSENLVREAIQRELNRGGQVYFVFNRVEGIEAMAARIRKMFPQVPVAVGHGQMSEASLERVMCDFLDGAYKILVSTTIIEAGLDIPNVNTLLVYEADKFGLAQLYQLRGRVGRSNRLAYAYLTYRRDKIVSDTAKKRLQAIKEFTELGSGFKVALRDLEIRGAGNILGAEQHGFMVAVGFDLYCRLLEQAVAAGKGRLQQEPFQPRLDLNINAYLPAAYVTGQDQRIDFYQRIYAAAAEEELRDVEQELQDRYGSPPAPVRNLLAVAELRLLARRLEIEVIRQQKEAVLVKFGPSGQFDGEALWSLVGEARGRVSISAGKTLVFKIKGGTEIDRLVHEMIPLLKKLLVIKTGLEPGSKGGERRWRENGDGWPACSS